MVMSNRPNVLIKVPTEEGLPAIRQLIDEGINVNATLLFGIPRYQAGRSLSRRTRSALNPAKADKNCSFGGQFLYQPDRYPGGPDAG